MKKVKKEKKGDVKSRINKDSFFKENYIKSWKYIKQSKKFIWAITFLFLFSAIMGFVFQPPEVVNLILEYIQEILEKTETMSSSDMIFFIFFNNLRIAFMGIIYGFAFGVFPVLSTFANGYVVGYVSSSAVSSSGVASLLSLLPHGIFELPAIFISFGLGLKFGTFFLHKEKLKKFTEFFTNSLRVFVLVIIPLLAVAAIIEGCLIFLFK
jgi:stage II sporulation protein M